jgi:hypothetical protein
MKAEINKTATDAAGSCEGESHPDLLTVVRRKTNDVAQLICTTPSIKNSHASCRGSLERFA